MKNRKRELCVKEFVWPTIYGWTSHKETESNRHLQSIHSSGPIQFLDLRGFTGWPVQFLNNSGQTVTASRNPLR